MEKLIAETMESYNMYIKKVPTGAEYIANNLREDNINDGLQTIKDFSEGVIWLTEVSELLNRNGITAKLDIQKIKGFLIEINEGLEKQDYVLVADMFEYEIAPFFIELEQAMGMEQ
ncbi:hypothetical protein MKY07_03480 [Solibacillus sp. FSL W7-1472]|uniref:hypothetical protein n=1 Tax=Solibacillus sp. FSL W7-1472 TaxID=2921707 RepID=UPI0030DB66BA